MDSNEKLMEAKRLFDEATALLAKDERSAEDLATAEKMVADAKAFKVEVKLESEILSEAQELIDIEGEKEDKSAKAARTKFASLGEYWCAVAAAGNVQYRGPLHNGLDRWNDKNEPSTPEHKAGPTAWESEFKAAMAEGAGATGGFLVPTEYLPELYGEDHERNSIRQRATVIPMRRRALQIPVLSSTGTTSGQPHQFGGMIASWTEEAAEKDENDPTFRQIELVAHKLVCYTRASDELLEDSAIGLTALLQGPLGFRGVIDWHEEYAFLQGTGAGQPLGVINAGATIAHARAATVPSIGVADLTGMLQRAYGDRLVWHISRSQMSNLLQLNGPTGNASYIFIPNGRDGMPATLFGYPVIWTEKLPAAGTKGDVVLADWTYYLIGDRQATTIDSTNAERFRYDQTSWRAVHRVDGQPWLSAPWTLADGTSTMSPFVVLDAKST